MEMMKTIFEIIEEQLDITQNDIIGYGIYGSWSYDMELPQSDVDMFIIVSDEFEFTFLHCLDYDIKIMPKQMFQEKINNHEVEALEILFDERNTFKEAFPFELDKSKLRQSFMAEISNSWVKAKKKMTIPYEDTYIGFKSIWHVFRMIDFGIQIATQGKIINYRFRTDLFDYRVDDMDLGWEYWERELKSEVNKRMSKFRKVAPKAVKS
ncbi:nucleotidyltransferase domain-containing protein [uncultured Arcobacter sp.]|uniref:nucleotidyltransferase domain-containing protein n=1 Tax=uncultured Arcobacter sp. TaxID=165434 RepID=UPI00260B7F6D|nr:nucleotidyltransferase domain-containing protein [uncultured Arcobacter sp.]